MKGAFRRDAVTRDHGQSHLIRSPSKAKPGDYHGRPNGDKVRQSFEIVEGTAC